MTIQIPNHGHCRICGRAVAFGDATCSEKCQKDMEAIHKKKKNMLLFIYGMIGLSVVILLLQLRQTS